MRHEKYVQSNVASSRSSGICLELYRSLFPPRSAGTASCLFTAYLADAIPARQRRRFGRKNRLSQFEPRNTPKRCAVFRQYFISCIWYFSWLRTPAITCGSSDHCSPRALPELRVACSRPTSICYIVSTTPAVTIAKRAEMRSGSRR